MTAVVRAMATGDWPAVERIYAAGIAGGNATFAEAPPMMADFFASRIPGLSLVAADVRGVVQGWVAATTGQGIGLMAYGPHAGTWRDTVLVEQRL
ncbi:GNAT family N-acetyltransferase [Specibacter cremeus]|uniref:GNAT family N-acetyltransferase n=1 Tax=Specibacter cremeus TaxID=1629051 RepID=UPI000F76956B|nr:hypothetical protein [Specibacter cremeus]